jgi:hypothetical protein
LPIDTRIVKQGQRFSYGSGAILYFLLDDHHPSGFVLLAA